jgi:hypothetical protein
MPLIKSGHTDVMFEMAAKAYSNGVCLMGRPMEVAAGE